MYQALSVWYIVWLRLAVASFSVCDQVQVHKLQTVRARLHLIVIWIRLTRITLVLLTQSEK